MSPVRTSVDERGVARVHLDDAAGRNALDARVVGALTAALVDLPAEARVVVLTGREDVFCAGASLDTLREVAARRVEPADAALTRALLEVPVPVVAAAEGHAVGGGLALVLCADLAVLAAESRYGAPFLDLGFTPGMGLTHLLEHAVGPGLAHELLYTAALRRGRDLEGTGLGRVVPREQVLATADDLAARIADKPPVAVRALKRALTLPKRRALEAARSLEPLLHDLCFHQPGLMDRIEDRYAG